MKQRKAEEKKLSMLRRMSAAVGRRFDLDPIVQTAVNEVGGVLGASRCFFYQIDSMGFVRLTHEFVQSGTPVLSIGTDIVMPVSYLARQTGQTVKADDVLNDGRFSEAMDHQISIELGILSALVTPVIFEDSVVGLLGVHQCDRLRRWTDDDVDLLETVAAHLAMLTQSCRVFSEQEKQAHVLARMNEDLSRLYVELAAKDAQIDKFINLISHDLRAPVVAIQGLVDLLRKDYDREPPESKPRRYLELITRSAEQITHLTGALLEYARLGQSSLYLTEISTEDLVRDIWQRFALSVPDATLEIFEALPAVRADRGKLVQIFQNLIENSIKYRNPEGKLIVDITGQETDECWQFAVNDNGVGFHPSEAENLFDLFARLKEVRNKPGSGIGLASVMEIARLHGGTAWAVGRPGKGATFYFTISKKVADRPQAAHSEPGA